MTTIRVDGRPNPERTSDFSIDPWKLIKMSRDKALAAAEKARERMKREKPVETPPSPPKPLPSEMKKGPSLSLETSRGHTEVAAVIPKPCWFPGSAGGRFSSPRRRFSGSPSPKQQRYRSTFDLKLSEMSGELETYISRQVVCSVLRRSEEDGAATPPPAAFDDDNPSARFSASGKRGSLPDLLHGIF